MSSLTAVAAQVVNGVEIEKTAKWYIWYYHDSAIKGWQQIDEHLMKITDQDNYTIVEYRTFTLKVRGRISDIEDLYSVCIWQVCIISEVHVLVTYWALCGAYAPPTH